MTDPLAPEAGAEEIAAAVRRGDVSATEVVDTALRRAAASSEFNIFTNITAERARRLAQSIDGRIASGEPVGPLAGVPFAVKDLFDLEGEVTVAGSVVLADQPAAVRDADAVAALVLADAVPIGALNMDEFAFGFTTENTHRGPARNPHDPTRTPGGSSGGSAAAVAAGVVPLSLGTDTNGSVRVPASLSGLFALKPTYGRISRQGVQLFSDSLDHVGLFTRSAADLRLSFSEFAAAGLASGDVMAADADADADAARDSRQLRVGVLGGWFAKNADSTALAARDRIAMALSDAIDEVEAPLAEAAQAAASVITYAEAGELHLDRIRSERHRFDPVVRHRLVAAALLPADWYVRAQRVRQVWCEQVNDLFTSYDLLLAPATPFCAPPIGTETVNVGGRELPARPALGWLTQPLTPTGVPIGIAPTMPPGGSLPIGVQLIAPAGHEQRILRSLAVVEASGVARSDVAASFRPADSPTDDEQSTTRYP